MLLNGGNNSNTLAANFYCIRVNFYGSYLDLDAQIAHSEQIFSKYDEEQPSIIW